MPQPWPPPPDLHSIQELVANADAEGFISIHGAPTDEYDVEAELLFKQIQHVPTADLTAAKIQPILDDIWRRSFELDETELALRTPALAELAAQIERFFGPEARPQVRGS